jgi:hypothetical protein
MNRVIFRMLMAAMLIATSAQHAAAQSDSSTPFLRPESAAPPNSASRPCDPQFPSKLPVRCWVNQKLMVLPVDKSLRSFGYQTINGGQGLYGNPTYEELAGKIVTVTGFEWQTNSIMPDLSNWLVTFRDDSTGNVYTTKTVILPGETPDDAVLDHFALLRDMAAARQRYLGKTFWMMAGWLPQLGDNGSLSFSAVVQYRKFVPVTVSDVLASSEAMHPVRIVIKNDGGQEGYFDIAMSDTNRSATPVGAAGDAALMEVLASSDPKPAHKWPATTWDAIENQRVFIGMTAEQARMSRGKPTSVNRTIVGGHVHEQWVYGEGSYLYFENGKLSAVQD